MQDDVSLAMPLVNFKPDGIISANLASVPKTPEAFSLAFTKARNMFLNHSQEQAGSDDEDKNSGQEGQTKDSEVHQPGEREIAAENRDVEESEDESDAWKIESKFQRIEEIPIDQLVEPT